MGSNCICRLPQFWVLLILPMLQLSAQEWEFTRLDLNVKPQGSRGVSIADLDGNGYLDIVVANQVDSLLQLGNTILFNTGEGFNQKAIANNKLEAWSESVHTVDVDNDHDLDIFFTTQFGVPNLLFENDGKGNFNPIQAGDLTTELTNSPGACWCDFDLDGDMDVFVVNRDGADDNLYVNDGNGTFNRTENDPWIGNKGDGRSCGWGDLNGDGNPDLYVANFVVKKDGKVTGKHRNYLYLSSSDGGFTEQKEGVLVEELQATYGVTFIDFDYDKNLDIYVTNVARSDENALYKNIGNGKFEKLSESGVAYEVRRPSKGQTWGDFNTDGFLDLHVANGTEGYPEIQNFLFAGKHDGSFRRVYNSLPVNQGHISAGTASGDLDNDGDLDLYVCNWGGEAEADDFYINQNTSGQWLKLRLQGMESNSFGVGSWVTLTLTNGTQLTRYFIRETGYGSENAPEIHFGIPSENQIEKIDIEWPSEIQQSSTNISVNTEYIAIEGKEIKPIEK